MAALALAAAVGVGGGAGLHFAFAARSSATPQQLALPSLHGQATWRANTRRAPAFPLLAAQRGRTVLLAFMDPLCKQECPIEGRALAATERQVSAGERAAVLIVSVNPEATAHDARAATRKWGLPADTHWVLGAEAQLARVWRAYSITVRPTKHDIVHSTAVYVIDKRGFERAGVLAPFMPQFVADDLRRLAREPM